MTSVAPPANTGWRKDGGDPSGRIELDVSEGTVIALRDALDLRGNIGEDAAITMIPGTGLERVAEEADPHSHR